MFRLKAVSRSKRPFGQDDDDESDEQGVFRSTARAKIQYSADNASGNEDAQDTESRDSATLVGRAASTNPSATSRPSEETDTEDPLDAFMCNIEVESARAVAASVVAAMTSSSGAPDKNATAAAVAVRGDIENEDNVESYIRHMHARGIEVGTGAQTSLEHHDDMDSDEEVYAAARAIDAQRGRSGQLVDDGDGRGLPGTGAGAEIDPLPPVDHASIEYPEFERCFYTEHPDIAALDKDKVAQIRDELGIHVRGYDPVRPCISFGHFGFDKALMAAIARKGYTEPSGIQRQAVPVALSGRDMIGIAQTGSGKTAAFLWPMLIHIMDQPELRRGDGPIGLILAPTRELAVQICSEAKAYARAYPDLRVSVLVGGADKGEQFKELRAGVEILVATPGRLIDLIKMKATNLLRVTFLVIDEADQMLKLGFDAQVRSICNHVRPDRQTLLFSATFPRRIEGLAREMLSNPIRVTVGEIGQSNANVMQIPVLFEAENQKWGWLSSQLPSLAKQGPVLIFVSRKAAVEELTQNLIKYLGTQIASISDTSLQDAVIGALHGDMLQMQRDATIREFKNGKTRVLVSTDVASRGLDIKGIQTVVNYDAARDLDAHVHRIGRTGRAGNKGTAYTLVTQTEDRFASDLVRSLEDAGQVPDEELVRVAMKNPRFRQMRVVGARGGRHGGGSDRRRGSRGRGAAHGSNRDGRGRGGGRFGHRGTSNGHTPLPSGFTPHFTKINFQKASNS